MAGKKHYLSSNRSELMNVTHDSASESHYARCKSVWAISSRNLGATRTSSAKFLHCFTVSLTSSMIPEAFLQRMDFPMISKSIFVMFLRLPLTLRACWLPHSLPGRFLPINGKASFQCRTRLPYCNRPFPLSRTRGWFPTVHH